MKHSKAVEYIRAALICVQKLRSNTAEVFDRQLQGNAFAKACMEEEYPWIYDEQKTIIKPLLQLTDRVDDGGKITPQEFYNIMYVISRWADIVDMQYILMTGDVSGFPKPDIQWLRGWEPES